MTLEELRSADRTAEWALLKIEPKLLKLIITWKNFDRIKCPKTKGKSIREIWEKTEVDWERLSVLTHVENIEFLKNKIEYLIMNGIILPDGTINDTIQVGLMGVLDEQGKNPKAD